VELSIKEGKFTLKSPRGTVEGTLQIDPSANPKRYQAVARDAEGEKVTSYGIYKMKDNTLTVCYVIGAADQRPKEFKAKEDSRAALIVYERKKPL
jgi:uncharacterized protein (TIGR03067 family)